MAKYDLPIWMHPFRGPDFADYQTEDRSQFEIWWTFGWPYDTSVAMARLVFEGYFDRFPNLKIIAHHMGAMIPYFEGRLGPGMDQLGSRTSDIDYTAVLKSLKKRPLDYFKMFYADTAVFGAYDATVCGLKFFGVDHVLFSSDAPFDPEQGPMYIRETITIVDRLEISEADREKIYWRNSAALLKLRGGFAAVTACSHDLVIRPAERRDEDAIWEIFHAVVQPGDTYAFPAEMSRRDALAYWLAPSAHTYVAVEDEGDRRNLRAESEPARTRIARVERRVHGVAVGAGARRRPAGWASTAWRKRAASDSARCSSISSCRPTSRRLRCGRSSDLRSSAPCTGRVRSPDARAGRCVRHVSFPDPAIHLN
mgnify:CR=1 FL=1